MDPERRNHVDKLLQSALDLPPAERDVFLRRACGGNEQLEREVRSLMTRTIVPTIFLAFRPSIWPHRSSPHRARAMTSRAAAIL